jgi:1,4-dihydroxy-6-naphthoate synthase
VKIAISPCPNDTFLFHGWLSGLVGLDLPVQVTFGDIQQLNEWALEKRFPLIKLSMGCFAHVQKDYELLPVGAALGFQCGPKIIALSPFPLSQLKTKTIAIPGKDTTAHLLLNRLLPSPQRKIFCLYHEIGTRIRMDEADCGLIIHESRFTFEQSGFQEIADLGELWHSKTKLPLPLGGLAILRSCSVSTKNRIIAILQESLNLGCQNPEQTLPFVLKHSQEKDPSIVKKHIATYVNSETLSLSNQGKKAIECILNENIDCVCPSQ